jgi:hypothetical protein
MAGTTTHSTAFRDAVADLVDSTLSTTAKLCFRTSGTVGTPGTAVATLAMSNPAFGASSSGVITASAITSDTNAAGGTIATATLQLGAGTVVVHCTVGTSGEAINVTSGGLSVTAGDTVSCSSLTYTAMP